MKTPYVVLFTLFLLNLYPSHLSAQQKQQHPINGRILSNTDQEALAGASIMVPGTGIHTTSNADGTFQLNLPADSAQLQVSYIGFKTLKIMVHVNNQTSSPLILKLQPSGAQLQQVTVSTGYQQLPLERVTGSFEVIDQKLYNRQVSTDVLSRLDAIASEVLFDKRGSAANQNFSIRGISSLGSSTQRQPLFIVDNFPYEGDIRNLNPNDVEQITILKDAAASSIWGARAGNGVVVITTKKAGYNQPFRLSLQSNVTLGEKPDVFYAPQMSSASFIEAERFLFDKGFYNSALSNTRARPVISPVVELLAKHRAGQLSQEELNSQIAELSSYDVRNDISKYLYRKSVNQQYALNLSGGSSNLHYTLSGGYDRNLLSQQSNDYQRTTLRSTVISKPIKQLELQAGLSYTATLAHNYNTAINPGGGKSVIYPYARLADAAGNALALEKDYRLSFVDTAGKGRLLDWHYRPLDEAELADNVSRIHDLVLNLGSRYQLYKTKANEWNAELRYQYERAATSSREHYSKDTYFARDLVNRYTQLTASSRTTIIPDGGILDLAEQVLDAHVARGQLNYSGHLGGQHQLEALAGAEIRQRRSSSSSGRSYGYDDNFMSFKQTDLVNSYPIYANLLANTQVPPNNAFSDVTSRFVSLFGNAAYTLKSRYILSSSIRKDASNLLGVATNQRGVPLWSVGLAWNLSRESFYTGTIRELLPFIKLRASYGYSGNVDNSLSALTTIAYRQPLFNSSTGLPYAQVQNPPNPELRWEKVRMFNLGLDFASKGNRLQGSLELYNKRASDLLSLVASDITSGFSTLTRNSAAMRTRGADISLNTLILPGRFRWEAAALYSYSKNKVTKYYSKPSSFSFYVGEGTGISPLEGQPAYNVVSYRWAGLDPATGNPIAFLNGQPSQDYTAITGKTTLEDLVFHGDAVPPVYGSLRQSFSYGNISLSFNISGRFAYYFRRSTINYANLMVSWVGHPDYDKRWQQPGDELNTTVPSMIYPANAQRERVYSQSEVTVERGDHIRLQDINLGYSFIRTAIPRLPFKQLDVFLYANNLGILWRKNKAGLDPDYGNNIPAAKSLSAGIRANF
ncbi:SusC/RagA family TonB-linked outer membrane protein [Desertivirga xinjiangensis]|uniref:SusC/RagA family TonB-linked outer membrane protein n=1 Tax=Desertivirga xinjiangensis TaxID=539206 RepID=UPI00210B9324|nr:SusC/RagA family TonB-linked outer membrane protein [Pedobacter xinjiangensis]